MKRQESIQRATKKVRLTEGDLRKIVNESVKRIVNEVSAFDPNGNFNQDRNRKICQERMKQELDKLNVAMGRAMTAFDHIAHFCGDEEIERRARVVINAIAEADRKMIKVNQLVGADRWNVSD